MKSVKMELLTPIHIGNGNFLQNKTDLITYKEGEDSFLSIVDPKKVLKLVGVEHIDDWVLSIENEADNTQKFVNRFHKGVHPSDYARRVITNFASFRPTDTLKECLHDGMGLPYIPGSSIKGAIRTSVLSGFVANKTALEYKVVNRGRYTAKPVEQNLFGGSPNQDIFRFLHIGDAYFEKGNEIAMRMVSLNIRKKDDLWDKSKSQIVEAIGINGEAMFQMNMAMEQCALARRSSIWKEILGDFSSEGKALRSLFGLINTQTGKLVRKEVKYWGRLMEGRYMGAEDYVENMQSILQEIEKCERGTECILRIGYGSGWRFITGAWTEKLGNFENIIAASRPGNRRYAEYDFPKSRRLDEDGDVLGFVKLTLI